MNNWNADAFKKTLTQLGRVIPAVSAVAMRENAESNAHRDKAHLHPSEICKKDWCPRSSCYTILGYPEETSESMTFQKLNIFRTGHDIHKKWQEWMANAGILEEDEVAVVSEKYHIMGHADGVIKDGNGRAVVEIKSVGLGTIRMEDSALFGLVSTGELSPDEAWNRIRKPFATHLRQLYLYMHILEIEKGVVIYEWKPNQSAKEFQVVYQDGPVQGILDSCIQVKEAITNKELVDRPMWATPTNRVCKSCPFYKECWKEEMYARSAPSAE